MKEEIMVFILLSPIIIYLLFVILFKNFAIGFTIIMFMLPFENLLGTGESGSISRYLIILTGVGCFLQKSLVLNKLSIFKDPIFNLILTLIFWSFASILWSVSPETSLITTITLIGNFILFSIVFLSNRKWLSIYWISLLIGCTASVILGNFLARPEGLENNLDRFTTGGQDPNDLAGLLLIAFSVGVYVFYSQLKSKRSRLLMFFNLATILIGVLLTLSRTGLIAMVVPLSFLALRKFKKKYFYLIILLFTSILYILGMDTINEFLNLFISPLFSRFNQLDESQFALARWDIWLAAIEVIKHNFFLGVGAGALPYVIDDYSSVRLPRSTYNPEIGLVAHNIILSVWSEMGLIGITIFVTILFFGFQYTLNLSKKDPWGLGMLVSILVVFVMGTTLSWENKKILYILFGSICLLYESKKNYLDD
ncbi:O-antigen ligase family protein [Nostoc parmelioides]|uniref:O-antigen ligase family protein n=1 Tax=Nostoc parmelioides FACHB-3921 TaxID=2692909 RepID=A0ABR8BCX1_9NOSO|nr:O-antigen ligase family protein [Nostoc parmelioides]MBD2251574.1 O-antigen ligase family protein [Nostoc parmelioides FACHB-3921]